MSEAAPGVSVGELLAAARALVGPHTDAQVEAILRLGQLEIDHDIAGWESSLGHVRSHRLRVGLPGELLEAVHAHPYLVDDVTRLVGAAIAARPHETIGELTFHLADGTVETAGGGPYRS